MALEISVIAPTRALLTTAQLRVAAGLAATNASRDAELSAIGLTVSDIISNWCNIAGDGITPVTLRQETLIETVRLTCGKSPLILSRRFLGTVSVVEADVALAATDFSINAGAGMLTRLSSDAETYWPTSKIIVTYEAGFATVPTDLVDVAAEMVARRIGASRDPMMRSERIEVPGVRTVDRSYWVDANDSVDLTPDMQSILNAYRTFAV